MFPLTADAIAPKTDLGPAWLTTGSLQTPLTEHWQFDILRSGAGS
jgi:hypothetical protein